jgi:glutamate/aspartate transport system substrate-binding protein
MFNLTKRILATCGLAAVSFTGANAEELGPTLQKVKDAGAITIGYRDAAIPISYLNAEQKPIGFSMDLCALVVEKIKQKLSLTDLNVNYRALTSENRVSLVGDGSVDIECGATPSTAELRKQVGFSVPIYASELRWLAPRKLLTEIDWYQRRHAKIVTSAEDLRWKTIVLTRGSPAMPLVLSLSNDRTLGLSIVEAKDPASSFKLVETGQASAFIADDILLMALKAASKTPDAYGFLEDGYPSVTYAFTLRRDDKPFKGLVDGVLSEAMTSGEYGKIYSKWFESPIPPKNVNLAYPMPRALRQLIKDPAQFASSEN